MNERIFRLALALICGLIGNRLIQIINVFINNNIISTIAGFLIALILWLAILFIYRKFLKKDKHISI